MSQFKEYYTRIVIDNLFDNRSVKIIYLIILMISGFVELRAQSSSTLCAVVETTNGERLEYLLNVLVRTAEYFGKLVYRRLFPAPVDAYDREKLFPADLSHVFIGHCLKTVLKRAQKAKQIITGRYVAEIDQIITDHFLYLHGYLSSIGNILPILCNVLPILSRVSSTRNLFHKTGFSQTGT